MAKILIQTQDYENYAWVDGELQTGKDAYWKAKGGRDIFVPVPGFREYDTFADKNLEQIVDSVRERIECNNDGYISTIIGYQLVDDDYMTEFEQSQLEYEGRITFPAEVIELETV
jgi:hypothetical protein